ncbi:hypothetical protein AVEN_263928-1 [Araneus ventricosus]|uniref:Uncharacterized protein n=1 Tax=Araneus ventricosus TaxID=182803 RepID=A0A4Y2T2Y2_ARAVE|nr:hypothetical protein AVEN_211252-1 [Araneus ventricosus]GBN93469.1 hypothetical protein AVEN_52838-1 [Araneus ventricosus]GBN93473.1 hypothetical protein AVEN_240063-1 [Araneus ventricosus]GBN93590.1 hypothetical protein AVEN_263928-1 [Araneus ventricosus]
MLPTWRCACAQNITSETVPGGEFGEQIIGCGGFQEWPSRSPDPTPGLFLVGIPQTAGVCDQSANIAGPSMTHYGCLYQPVTRYATPCAT